MTARLLRYLTVAVAAVVVGGLWSTTTGSAPANAATLGDAVALTIDPPQRSVTLGENIDLVVTVVNNDAEATPPLVIHIDITKPDQATSVDPEDWTPTLSKPIGSLAPGETVTVDWNIQPISSGTFVTYAVALAAGVDSIASSNVMEVTVDHQRTLDPGGILPVAIAAPGLVGALLLAQLRIARRTVSRGAP